MVSSPATRQTFDPPPSAEAPTARAQGRQDATPAQPGAHHHPDRATRYGLLVTRTERPRPLERVTLAASGVAPVTFATNATPDRYQRTHQATRTETMTVCCAITRGPCIPCPAVFWRHGIRPCARAHRGIRTAPACLRRRLRRHRTDLPCGQARSRAGIGSTIRNARSADQRTRPATGGLAACGLSCAWRLAWMQREA